MMQNLCAETTTLKYILLEKPTILHWYYLNNIVASLNAAKVDYVVYPE